MANTIKTIENAYKSDNRITGITSGFIDIDKRLGGLNRSDLVVLAGRPSMGKTALATNIAFNAALAYLKNSDGGGKVAFFSLEMSAEQLVTRIFAHECEIPSHRIRRGEIREEDFSGIVAVEKQLGELPLFIDDTPALTISSLRTRARKLKRQHGIDLIVIDYLQLLQGSGDKLHENRVQEISEITRLLKALAKELNVPVLALSQLSRAVESRDEKRPQLADLRESGSIEQDADVVMFIYREEYYEARRQPAPDTDKHKEWEKKMEKIHNLAEVIIAKQRHGPIGTIQLFFDGNYTKFDDLSESRKSDNE
ncbi:MAG: replicative DNA helicase [Holosporaceae bacterium]|jgi:replicative DNA helicase|nr:replicative DNA helicase [Holosporaceae bacterium]